MPTISATVPPEIPGTSSAEPINAPRIRLKMCCKVNPLTCIEERFTVHVYAHKIESPRGLSAKERQHVINIKVRNVRRNHAAVKRTQACPHADRNEHIEDDIEHRALRALGNWDRRAGRRA